ncbi:MAG: putative RDD family membrane protein YckC [Glaciecola sp.]|jgi:uncharacterized RDD family membrane protein YckC
MSNNDEQVYSAPESVLVDESNTLMGDDNLASRGSRLGATILDVFIMVLFFIPGIVIMALMGGNFSGDDATQMTMDIYLYSGVFLLAYFIINGVLLYKYGQTMAKRLLKIKIVRTDGTRTAFGRMLGLRIVLIQVLTQIPIIGALFALVNVLFIFREDQRCVHDLIADTKVINT